LYRQITLRAAGFSVFLLTIIWLSGCTSLPAGEKERLSADSIARPAGLHAVIESVGEFDLLTYRRGLDNSNTARSEPVHIYFEGDGRAWRFRRPPRNPTPSNPLGLRLAALDSAPAILWIARPCMYLPDTAADSCDSKWWTSHRYAPDVIEAVNALISRVVGDRQVRLIGHSGGGTLAVLAASRRDDVESLLTVGSPLDITYWAEKGDMTPLHGSVDPVDVAHLLVDVPQRHLVGGADQIVPPEVVRRYIRAIPQPNHATLKVYPDSTHKCCWEKDWPQLLAE
jgi:pimeloyl-ACP methyl ester carboxylesterase